MNAHSNKIYEDFENCIFTDAPGSVTHRTGLYRTVLKRLLDVLFVLAVSPVVVPLLSVLAAVIFLRDGHSPIYWSERVGRNGRLFWMMKLRTMVPDADTHLAVYLADHPKAAAEWTTTQKLKCDPRITRLGRILRKSSLDELPQLWNVLIGDMSLVGPRPMMPGQRALYPGLAYYAMRPGVTGPWQVSDRNECAFAKRADFDHDYDRSLSLLGDLRLLLATMAVVARGTGY